MSVYSLVPSSAEYVSLSNFAATAASSLPGKPGGGPKPAPTAPSSAPGKTSSGPKLVPLSELDDYVTSTQPAEYMAVSGFEGFGQVAGPRMPTGGRPTRPHRPMTVTAFSGLDGLGEYFTASKTMWALLLVAAGSAGFLYWKMRKAGVAVLPLFGLDGLGHSGRTAYGVFPKHRGYGHHRTATGRFHFHR